MEFTGDSFDKSGNSCGIYRGIRLTNLGIHVEFIGNSFDKSGNSCGIYRDFV